MRLSYLYHNQLLKSYELFLLIFQLELARSLIPVSLGSSFALKPILTRDRRIFKNPCDEKESNSQKEQADPEKAHK